MKQLLKSLGIKQVELAAALGVSESTMSNWVNFVTPVPAEWLVELERHSRISRQKWRPDLYPEASLETVSVPASCGASPASSPGFSPET
jgi:DNA-binding transcriptional regulator YdaS (Cro superfamily)